MPVVKSTGSIALISAKSGLDFVAYNYRAEYDCAGSHSVKKNFELKRVDEFKIFDSRPLLFLICPETRYEL